MLVRCILTYPTPEDLNALGTEFFPQQAFHLSKERVYVVLGVGFTVGAPALGTGAIFLVEDDYGHPVEAPACLFEIIDGRLSELWEARAPVRGWLVFWPQAFFRPHFFEDLADGEPETERIYKDLVALLQNEVDHQGRSI